MATAAATGSIATLRQLLRKRSGDDLGSIMEDRARFYQVTFSVSDNKELQRSLPNARAHLFRSQFFDPLTPTDLKSMMSEYEAIRAGDHAKAEQRMRRHIVKTSARTLRRLAG